MALPNISLTINNNIKGLPESGDLLYKYSAFQNLKLSEVDLNKPSLGDLRLSSDLAGINIDKPIQLTTEVDYDDSVNLIINDGSNPLKVVNSRFYLTDSNHFIIADRKGNLDTNIYTETQFKEESSLIKTINTIPKVEFLGVFNGGVMPVGSYSFYFKLSDSDGNETDFVAESGKVVCYIGSVNNPFSIRGGQNDENSYKLIKFKLKNLDLAYDYINIYYSRSSGDSSVEVIKTYKIADKIKITNTDTEISITGYENHIEISQDDINIQYTTFDSVKSTESCQNMMFAGNITNDYELFKTLEKYSLYITPELTNEESIGNLSETYKNSNTLNPNEYFNPNNIYYRLGYWDQEIYRFGVVYILNDYTLSPVFNIRGKKELKGGENSWTSFNLSSNINYGEDFLIEGTTDENAKGVFKINSNNLLVFNGERDIKPLGIKFNFWKDENSEKSIINGDNTIGGIPGLNDLTKGFFIVRQKRIPTILTQGLGIATSAKSKTPMVRASSGYFGESFLSKDTKPKLKREFFSLNDNEVKTNALLCPESTLKPDVYNTLFNGSEYILSEYKYAPYTATLLKNLNFNYKNEDHYYLNRLYNRLDTPASNIKASLLQITPGIEKIKNKDFTFCSKAGHEIAVWKYLDAKYGDFNDPQNTATASEHNDSKYKLRGLFNSYIGADISNIVHGQIYNIFQKDYDFNTYWKEYFKIRYSDSSPYSAISNRYSWDDISLNKTESLYRGDCYICTYTHRMNWNFIDSEMPTNKTIVDPYTWYKNFKIVSKASTVVDNNGTPDTSLVYNKLLPLFTYKNVNEYSYKDENIENEISSGLIEPDGKKFKKYSEINGLFGTEKINKPDVNAVGLGHWVTFKICSNVNLSLRDVDFSNPMEEALHKQKRGFYPLMSLDKNNSLPESNSINLGISKSLSNKYYFEIQDVPFIKTNFSNRIYYSNVLQSSSFVNGNRIFESKNYQDFTKEYGALVKLVEWYGKLIAIMEHGILMIPVNERAMMANESGENIYINTDNVLPKNPKVISNMFGSIWADSVIKTSRFIYGIDTVGKKIWRTNGESFEIISDLKIQKFLNDNINLKESDKDNSVGVNSIKSHFNAFKQDVLFVFNYSDKKWNLCWNEVLNKWVTQYTWFPEFSENINNIFYTFANNSEHSLALNNLYKHGFSGYTEESGNIKPTMWYDEQHPFEYEFVVNDSPGIQKIFNNLKIISNLAKPDSFYYEVVGEGFDWVKYKQIIVNLNKLVSRYNNDGTPRDIELIESDLKNVYQTYLLDTPEIKKLPFIILQTFDVNDIYFSFFNNKSILKDLTIREHNKTKELLVNGYQKGLNLKTEGRLRGNMQYLEDSWDIQLSPISFKYAYLSGDQLVFTKLAESKIRDKYIKIRIKYSGNEYAIINAIRTNFTISYA